MKENKNILNTFLIILVIFIGALLGRDMYAKKSKENRLLRKARRETLREERKEKRDELSDVFKNTSHSSRYIRLR